MKSAIFTKANNLRVKPNAKAKLAAVHTLIGHCCANGIEAGSPVFDALVTLYAQHLPKTPAKPKNGFDWVQKAVAKNDLRIYLNQANVEAGNVRATDGHRVHVAPTELPVDGFYDSARELVEVDGRFPQLDRVTPSHTAGGRVKVDLATLRAPVVSENGKCCTAAELRAPGTLNKDDKGVFVQLKYLNDALSNPSELDHASTGDDSTSNLLLTFVDGSFAVVMPLRP